MQKWIEQLLPFILPILAGQADGTLPEAPKRLGYNVLLQLNSESIEWLKKKQTHLPAAAFDAFVAEARKEWEEFGHPEVPDLLDQFVAFKTT